MRYPTRRQNPTASVGALGTVLAIDAVGVVRLGIPARRLLVWVALLELHHKHLLLARLVADGHLEADDVAHALVGLIGKRQFPARLEKVFRIGSPRRPVDRLTGSIGDGAKIEQIAADGIHGLGLLRRWL